MNEDEAHVHEFLDLACVKLGFCLPPDAQIAIATGGPYTASELAEIILIKEGLNPEAERRLFRDLRDAYTTFVAKKEGLDASG